MSLRRAVLLALVTAIPCLAEEATETSPRMKEILKARMAEDAKKQEASKPAAAPTAATTPTAPATAKAGVSSAAPVTAPAKTTAPKKSPSTKAAASGAATENPTVLPRVEVRKGRITVLDQQLAKQEQEIAREKKNLKTSEMDAALNDAKIARPLSIFGGESTQFRRGVASERVELMEAEKDLMEAIAQAKTKEEKAALQKQLNELKAMRRDLEKAMR